MRYYINWRAALLLSSILLLMISCGKTPSEDDSDSTEDYTLVKPAFNKSKVLKNPLTGWVMYGSASGDPSYWDTSIYVPDEGASVYVKDYATCAYIRTGWSIFNPSDGVYAWRDPSTALYKMIQGALDRGLPIAFRFVVDGRDQRANTPRFVLDAGAEYGVENTKFPDRTTPLPQDPVFQRYYEKFIAALAEDFDDPSKCAFIDAYGLGKWGEGHTVAYNSTDLGLVDDNTERLKEEVMVWITSLYAKYFKHVPLVINYHRVIGHPTGTGGANANSDKLLSIAVNNGYCLRSDAFGMNSYYGTWEKTCANTYRYKRPIIMEGGWIVSQHSYWNDPAGYRQDHPEDVRKGEFEASREARVNMMDFRVGNETQSWFVNAFSYVKQFVTEGGYRLYPDQVSLPSSVKSGSSVKITSRWRNMGWGYCPNNIPQWNYKYKVAFALLDGTDKPVEVFVDDNCEPSTWVESKPNPYEFNVKVSCAPGNYMWAVAIVDTTKENAPGLLLAVNNESTSDGWVKLLDVKVD